MLRESLMIIYCTFMLLRLKLKHKYYLINSVREKCLFHRVTFINLVINKT